MGNSTEHVQRCLECNEHFCKECEQDTFDCENCGESFCDDCADGFSDVPVDNWCRECFEECCSECGMVERMCTGHEQGESYD